MATQLLTLAAYKTLKTMRMYFDLKAHLTSLPQLATNYCSLGCSKRPQIATPLLRMTPEQKTLKVIWMYFDPLPDSCSLPHMTTNSCYLTFLKQTLMSTPLLRMTPGEKTLKAIRI